MDTYGEVAADLRNELTSDYLKYGAAYYPYLKTSLNYHFEDADVTIKHGVDDGSTVSDGALNDDKLDTIKAANNALYNQVKQELAKITMILPANATMAGIYARVDRDRGVWKAPANVAVAGIIGPNKKVTNEDQDGLNVDTTAGKSINAIRNFSGKGTLVWGARTLAGNDNEWRYVSVRRLFNMVEESVKKSTGWAVFEANDANTWTKVKAQIENYLTRLWQDGALAGATTEHAFFVKVGLGVTMTAIDILEGRMIVEIGMAAVRPAEFIILRFSHKMQES
jgi:phage tail sheath protein FI